MGLGELCEPMQTCNCSNPMKKRPLLLESFYGAPNGLISEPHLSNIIVSIDTELSQILIERMQKLIAA